MYSRYLQGCLPAVFEPGQLLRPWGCLTKSVRVIDKFQMITSSDKYNLHESDDILASY